MKKMMAFQRQELFNSIHYIQQLYHSGYSIPNWNQSLVTHHTKDAMKWINCRWFEPIPKMDRITYSSATLDQEPVDPRRTPVSIERLERVRALKDVCVHRLWYFCGSSSLANCQPQSASIITSSSWTTRTILKRPFAFWQKSWTASCLVKAFASLPRALQNYI